MSTQYSLTCHIDQRWVKEWGGDKSPMRFCFAQAMGDGDEVFNVVAHASVVAGSITVKWKEDYFIAASKTSVEHGVTVTSATNYAPIKFGQRYTCNASWLDSDAGSDPSAPEDGFLFKNKDTPAAAVIAKKINGKTTPYYISPVLLPPAGRLGGSKLIPTPTVAVWFQMDVDNGTMIESDNSDLYIIKLKGPSAKATFDKDGFWGPGKNLDD